ncbi:2-hydroxyacid dehydrogenase [Pikeienuella sp. HZG-20]|uniref:2-hydroxyacid dehydrogenase n=1 Tax=Paludibacillus litoralis TaxID=3133267 RepID=UPI0030EEE85F
MSKPDILVVGKRPEWYFRSLEEEFTVHRAPDDDPAHVSPDLAKRVEALTSSSIVGRRMIDALPALRLVASGAAGYEKIDVGALRERGIPLTNTPSVTDGCVADMAFALLLAAARSVAAADRFIRAGRWPTEEFPLVPRVFGRRLGILGMGRIGVEVAKRAAGFDMPVSYHNRSPVRGSPHTYCATLLELAQSSDFLIVACPGGAETRHIVNQAVLEALGPTGVVVNIARGSIIDQQALTQALAQGRIMAAGLDVFENEPHVPPELASLENVVLTPHRGGGTHQTWRAACELVKANLRAHFRGEPLVTPVDITSDG